MNAVSSASSDIKISLLDDDDDDILIQDPFQQSSQQPRKNSESISTPKKLTVKFISSAKPSSAPAASSSAAPELEPLAEVPNNTDLSSTVDMDFENGDSPALDNPEGTKTSNDSAISFKSGSAPLASASETKSSNRLKRLRDLNGVDDDPFSQDRIAEELEDLLALPEESEEPEEPKRPYKMHELDKLIGRDALPPRKKRVAASSTTRKRKRSDGQDSDEIYDSDDFQPVQPRAKSKGSRGKIDDYFNDAAMEYGGDDDDDDISDDSLLDEAEEADEEDDLLEDDFMQPPKAKKAKANKKAPKQRKKRSIVPEDFDVDALSIDDDDDKMDDEPIEIENATVEDVGDLKLSAAGDPVEHIVPAAVNNRLRQYQRDGVKFLYSLFKQGKGGILGDDMGLGKTIQTIAFLLAIMPKQDPSADTDWLTGNHLLSPKKASADPSKPVHQPVCIVVPGSVLHNWRKEITAWFKIADRKHKLLLHHGANRKCSKKLFEKNDIVLTTYDIFRIEFDTMNQVDWLVLMFDEVHKIKDRKTKLATTLARLNCLKRYGLTGTVVQNNFEELHTLLDFVQPGAVGTLSQFRSAYITPIKNGQRQHADFRDIAYRRWVVRNLNAEFKKIVLRRDKSVIKDLLPPKTDNIVFCQMSSLQLDIYKRAMQSETIARMLQWVSPCPCERHVNKTYGQCCGAGEEAGDLFKELFPTLNHLMKISNDLRLAVPKPDKGNPEKEAREKAFFNNAIGPDRDKLIEFIAAGEDEMLCGKLGTLRSLMEIWDKQGRKVLVFSSKTSLLDKIQSFLARIYTKERITRLDGSTPIAERQNILDAYNSEPQKRRFIFLISTKAGGLGLNITSAHTVVVFDPSWNATWDLQAQDRVHRIGQTKKTEIFRFVSTGSIEEIIYNRQIYKQQMANIGTQGSHERRFFKGVQGRRGEEGELFGLVNLLKFAKDRIFTKEVLEQEQSYVIKAIEDANNVDGKSKSLDEALLAEVFDADKYDADDVEDLTGLHADGVYDLNALGSRMAARSANGGNVIAADVQAALEASGVQYLHNNQRLIGNSKVEEFITKQAEKMHGTGGAPDIDMSQLGAMARDPHSFGAPARRPDFTREYDAYDVMDRMDEIHRAQWAAAIAGTAGPPLASFKRAADFGVPPPRPTFDSPYIPQSNLASGIAQLNRVKSDPVIQPRIPRPPMTSSLSSAQMQSRMKPSSSKEVIEIDDEAPPIVKPTQTPSYNYEAVRAAYREQQLRSRLYQPAQIPPKDYKVKQDENGIEVIDLVDD